MSPTGRSQDIDAILSVIQNANKFIHISVMDYIPMSLYGPKLKYVEMYIYLELPIYNFKILLTFRYWPVIDNALRTAAIDRKVSVKLLISYWKSSRPAEDYFLNSLKAISHSYRGVEIQVV